MNEPLHDLTNKELLQALNLARVNRNGLTDTAKEDVDHRIRILETELDRRCS